jgi:hypothetical protein
MGATARHAMAHASSTRRLPSLKPEEVEALWAYVISN